MRTIHNKNPEAFPFFKPVREAYELNFFEKWILNREFVKRAVREAELKAFPKAQKDVLETMRDDIDAQAEEVAGKKLNDLLSPADLNNIVTLDKQRGIVFIGGIKVDETRLLNLKAEAESLVQFDLWKLLHETPKELAQRSMFVNGESLDDMKKGKSILYTLSTQTNIIEIFKNYNPKKPMQPPKP